MTDFVIDARDVVRQFGQFTAVGGVTLQVRPGEIFGLLGPNGSGKSTMIRMLCGVLPPTSGSIHVLGNDVVAAPEEVKRHIGYMSQSFSLYADLSVLENIHFYGRIYGLSQERLDQRTEEVLALTSLQPRIHQLAGTLSGGWKQRLALACALIHEPKLLFLDEPTAGIDPVARRDLWDLLFQLAGNGVSLLVTTHYMDEAERCAQVAYLHSGQLIVIGPPEHLKQREEVTPSGTRRWELTAAHPAEQFAVLRNHPAVLDATFFGDAIHILASDQLDAAAIAHLTSSHADAIRPIEPSLEDVFVMMTRDLTRDDDPEPIADTADTSEGEMMPAEVAAAAAAATAATSAAEKATFPEDSVDSERTARPHAVSALSPQRKRPLAGCLAILLKELSHIRRQPSTLVFMLIVPVMQTLIFGYAINTEIENIPTVVYDLDGRQAARELREAIVNTRTFRVTERVTDESAFQRAMISGRAKVGIRIPPDFSERLLHQEQASVQVLIDGSDSQVAMSALNTANLLGVNLSLRRTRPFADRLPAVPSRDAVGRPALPIEMRPRLLYNPNLESSHFFVPGLVGIILQLVTLFLTSFAIVRERELGTLEQLFVTPVSRAGLLLGKLLPYAGIGFLEVLIVLTVMVTIFGVPIRGSLPVLLVLSLLFLVCGLGLGLLVSTLAKTQVAAIQFAFLIMLPSVLLSGFMFPRSEMPLPIFVMTHIIPVTYFLEILRGVILRGAGFTDMLPHIAGLLICTAAIFAISLAKFRKQLA
ncbi:MAG: ABC transporter ATP-binding protein/permease [Planctomycetaceae bacterium]|nr:ABC transporter ATP-binding protein/permease [Planctomycetaceae bacterium]